MAFIVMQKPEKEFGEPFVFYMQKNAYIDIIAALKPDQSQKMMKTINEITQNIIREFDLYATVDEKYAYLFQIGEQMPPMDPNLKSEANKVQGCQSDLWFDLRYEEGHFSLNADSDSMVIKGIAALLVRVVENCPPEAVPQLNLDFID